MVTHYCGASGPGRKKHFPGHGAAALDSHLEMPVINCSADELHRVHLDPFRAVLQAGAQTVMTAHVLVSTLDPSLPATLSRRILTGLLRKEMAFDGIIITDQMTMRGVAERWGAPRASAMALIAGADVVLGGGEAELQVEAVKEIHDAIRRGELTEERVTESAQRVLLAKAACGLFHSTRSENDRDFVGSSSDFACELAQRSITLLRNESTLPLSTGVRTLVAGITQTTNRGALLGTHVPTNASLVHQAAGGTVTSWHSESDDPSPEEIQQATNPSRDADQAIVFTYSRGSWLEARSSWCARCRGRVPGWQ